MEAKSKFITKLIATFIPKVKLFMNKVVSWLRNKFLLTRKKTSSNLINRDDENYVQFCFWKSMIDISKRTDRFNQNQK